MKPYNSKALLKCLHIYRKLVKENEILYDVTCDHISKTFLSM